MVSASASCDRQAERSRSNLGWPMSSSCCKFLPQVIRGTYSEVEVTTRGIMSGPLRIDRVESHLFDVRVPFHDVLVRSIRRVGIGRSVETINVSYRDLNAYFAATGRR